MYVAGEWPANSPVPEECREKSAETRGRSAPPKGAGASVAPSPRHKSKCKLSALAPDGTVVDPFKQPLGLYCLIKGFWRLWGAGCPTSRMVWLTI